MDKLDLRDIEPELLEDMKKLVLARIKAASDNLVISVGERQYTKEEILEGVEKGDEIGLEIIDMQMGFLRDMASGAFYEQT
jgi:hypothetical protein